MWEAVQSHPGGPAPLGDATRCSELVPVPLHLACRMDHLEVVTGMCWTIGVLFLVPVHTSLLLLQSVRFYCLPWNMLQIWSRDFCRLPLSTLVFLNTWECRGREIESRKCLYVILGNRWRRERTCNFWKGFKTFLLTAGLCSRNREPCVRRGHNFMIFDFNKRRNQGEEARLLQRSACTRSNVFFFFNRGSLSTCLITLAHEKLTSGDLRHCITSAPSVLERPE